jgi:hypothetical protein
MSTQVLIANGAKPAAYTYDGSQIHLVSTSNYEEKTFQCTPPLLQLSQGSTTQISLTWSSDERYVLEDLNLEWTATNSSGTDAPRFFNTFQTLSSLKVLINGVQSSFLMDQQQIQAAVSLYLSQFPLPYNEINKARTSEVGNTLNGEQITVSSTRDFCLPLFWLVPELKKMVVNLSGIYKLEFQITFQQNTNSATTNGYFVQSNTTSNAYSSNITYSGIQVRQCLTRHSDPRMYMVPNPNAMVCSQFDTVLRSVSWTNVNSDKILLNLSNDLTRRNRICGLSIWGFDMTSIAGYNDVDCGKMFSGPSYFGYLIKSRSNILVDHSNAIGDLPKRRRYTDEYFKKRFGHNADMELIANSSNLGKYYIFSTYIDLSNIYNDDDAVSLSGRDNFQNDIEIQLICASSVSASCNIYIMPEYQSLYYVDPKTRGLKYI